MKKAAFSSLCAALLIAFFSSCSKDFNSNAEYRDVTIVYGVLDASKPVNYIKIYKGFLTADDAYQAAKVYDSLYYFDKITVVLEEYDKTRRTGSWTLDYTTDIPRENGDFTDEQLLYVVPCTLNPDRRYKLVITNKETGRVVTAEANIVGDFQIDQHMATYLNVVSESNAPFNFSLPQNGASYQIYQVFHYIERDAEGNEERKSFRRRLVGTNVTTNANVQYTPSVLYTAIANNVSENRNVERYIVLDSCIQFEVWAVDEHVANYVMANTPSGSVVMDRLRYTNIACEDGLVAGIFGSRRYATSWHGMNENSQKELVTGSLTRHLKFHYAWEYEALHN